MRRIKSTNKPQKLRKQAETRWENEGGATVPTEHPNSESSVPKSTHVTWKIRTIIARFMNRLFNPKAGNMMASRVLSSHAKSVRRIGNGENSQSRSINRARARRGLAALKVRTVSNPGYDIVSLH